MKRSRAIAGSAVLAVAGLATMASATTASAAPAAASAVYNGACGSGYVQVNKQDIGSTGTVFLTYNAQNGQNCVVTVRNSPGNPVYMAAYVGKTGDEDSRVYDTGQYTSYAGPVYIQGKGICVDWGGTIEGRSVDISGSNCGKLAPGVVTKH